VEHSDAEEYKKSGELKFIYCFGVSKLTISLLIT